MNSMAVARLIGRTDTFEVIFDKIADDHWSVEVPANVVGEYIMDLFAVDEAGNVGFMATAMFTVDTTNLCIHFKIINYECDISFANDYVCEIKEAIPCAVTI